ncbi:Uncharacterised protein [Streptococcus pneumoniae]|nr:Uncharacterised protein [Streptococcus pneumoniae]
MTPEEQMELNYFYEEMESYYDEEEQGEIFDLYDN